MSGQRRVSDASRAPAAAEVAGTEPAEESRPRRLSAERRRQQLLDTAAELLVSEGVDALTMEAIGQRSGASKTLGYAYFTNVDHVLLALRERELRLLYERVRRAASAATTFDAQMHAALTAYFDSVAERGLLLIELEQAVRARRIVTSPTDGTNDFLDWLADLINAELSVGRRRAKVLAGVVAASVNTHAAIWRASRFTRAQIEAAALAFVLGGMRSAAAQAVAEAVAAETGHGEDVRRR